MATVCYSSAAVCLLEITDHIIH